MRLLRTFIIIIIIIIIIIRCLRSHQGPVSRKSRNFSGHFRVSQFPLYLKNGKDLSRQTLQLFFFFVKRSALQNKRLAVSQMAFRARKVFGTFEKRAPGYSCRSDHIPNVSDRCLFFAHSSFKVCMSLWAANS